MGGCVFRLLPVAFCTLFLVGAFLGGKLLTVFSIDLETGASSGAKRGRSMEQKDMGTSEIVR